MRYISLKKMKNCGRFVPDGGYTWEFLVGVCCPVHKILTLFQTKKCPFPHPFSVLASKKLCHQFAKMRTPTTNFFKSISNWHIACVQTSPISFIARVKGPFSACNKGNRRRLHAGKLAYYSFFLIHLES